MASNLIIVDHPLVAHKLSLLREKTTPSMQFRQLMREASLLIGYEVLRDLPTEHRLIETPAAPMQAPFLKCKKPVFVPILRAGIGLLDGLLDLVPSARVGHIGLYRDPATLAANEYYLKMPEDLADRLVIVCDPMLATGNSAIAAVACLMEAGVRDIKLVSLLAAPEGIRAFHNAHPGTPIITVEVGRIAWCTEKLGVCETRMLCDDPTMPAAFSPPETQASMGALRGTEPQQR